MSQGGHAPFVQRHARAPALDLATLQAVEAVRDALRRRRTLEREVLVGQTVVYRSDHARKLRNAVNAHLAARNALDQLLEDA